MAWTLTKHGEFYYSACHVEELRGIPSGEFVNGMRVWVTGLGEYQMDTSESSADDGSLYIKPSDVDPADPARWVLIDPWKTATGFIGYTPGSFAPFAHTHPWSAIVPGSWKMFYSDGTPSVQELSLATAGRFLMTAGASSAPFFEAAAKLTWDTTNIRLGVGKDAPDVTVDSLVTDDSRLMSFPLHIGHKSSDTVAGKILGTGVGMKFLVSATNNGVPVAQALIGSKWINKTAGSYDSILGFATVGIGGTLDTRAWVGSNGLTLLNAAGKECVFDPSSVAADITYTLPADNGDPGEVLVTDGSGVLSWGAPGAGVMATLTNGSGLSGPDYDGSVARTWDLDLASLNVWQATQTWRANAAGAGTAPMKFQAGVVMTTPEAGALEWDGTNLWITTDIDVPGEVPAGVTLGAWKLFYTDADGDWTELALDTSDTRKYLSCLSVGGVPTAPTWEEVVGGSGPPTYAYIVDDDAATVTFDLEDGSHHEVVMDSGDANRTLDVSNASVGQMFTITLTQDGTGSRTVTWWSGIKWPADVVPTLTTTGDRKDCFCFKCIAAGAYEGFILGMNLALPA